MFTSSRKLFLILLILNSFLFFFSVDSKPIEESSVNDDSDELSLYIGNMNEKLSESNDLEENMNFDVDYVNKYLKRTDIQPVENKPKKYKCLIKIVVCILRTQVSL
jgi:hypothetical protein